ncbi:MAG: menaquinone biosynthesis protein [Chitinophagaceae bacterium]
MDKIKVGIVSYLNTRPLIYGLQLPPIADKIELVEAYPSRLADMLLNNEVDVGLIPVAAIPQFKEHHIVSDYCIGAEGEVASVCLFSEVPVEKIEKVYLDYQSRSSVALLKWLIKEYWGIHPELIETSDENYIQQIKGTSAGLVIGDRALKQRKVSTFIYDLGAEWRFVTGLPFVFAAWISNKMLPQDFIDEFNAANALGLQNVEAIAQQHPFPDYDLKKYYNFHISYRLTEQKRKGMELFLSHLK